MTQKIHSKQLLSDVKKLEDTVTQALIKSGREAELIQKSKALYLAKKLINFSLTAEEWSEYKSAVDRSTLRRQDLKWFENFYETAELRNIAMVQNFLAALKERHGNGTRILVTGAFHSEDIDRQLRDAGLTVISLNPKVTQVESENGTSYLNVFAQQKTPLDQLFSGQKLFLPPPVDQISDFDTAIADAASAYLNNLYPRRTASANHVRRSLVKRISADCFAAIKRTGRIIVNFSTERKIASVLYEPIFTFREILKQLWTRLFPDISIIWLEVFMLGIRLPVGLVRNATTGTGNDGADLSPKRDRAATYLFSAIESFPTNVVLYVDPRWTFTIRNEKGLAHLKKVLGEVKTTEFFSRLSSKNREAANYLFLIYNSFHGVFTVSAETMQAFRETIDADDDAAVIHIGGLTFAEKTFCATADGTNESSRAIEMAKRYGEFDSSHPNNRGDDEYLLLRDLYAHTVSIIDVYGRQAMTRSYRSVRGNLTTYPSELTSKMILKHPRLIIQNRAWSPRISAAVIAIQQAMIIHEPRIICQYLRRINSIDNIFALYSSEQDFREVLQNEAHQYETPSRLFVGSEETYRRDHGAFLKFENERRILFGRGAATLLKLMKISGQQAFSFTTQEAEKLREIIYRLHENRIGTGHELAELKALSERFKPDVPVKFWSQAREAIESDSRHPASLLSLLLFSFLILAGGTVCIHLLFHVDVQMVANMVPIFFVGGLAPAGLFKPKYSKEVKELIQRIYAEENLITNVSFMLNGLLAMDQAKRIEFFNALAWLADEHKFRDVVARALIGQTEIDRDLRDILVGIIKNDTSKHAVLTYELLCERMTFEQSEFLAQQFNSFIADVSDDRLIVDLTAATIASKHEISLRELKKFSYSSLPALLRALNHRQARFAEMIKLEKIDQAAYYILLALFGYLEDLSTFKLSPDMKESPVANEIKKLQEQIPQKHEDIHEHLYVISHFNRQVKTAKGVDWLYSARRALVLNVNYAMYLSSTDKRPTKTLMARITELARHRTDAIMAHRKALGIRTKAPSFDMILSLLFIVSVTSLKINAGSSPFFALLHSSDFIDDKHSSLFLTVVPFIKWIATGVILILVSFVDPIKRSFHGIARKATSRSSRWIAIVVLLFSLESRVGFSAPTAPNSSYPFPAVPLQVNQITGVKTATLAEARYQAALSHGYEIENSNLALSIRIQNENDVELASTHISKALASMWPTATLALPAPATEDLKAALLNKIAGAADRRRVVFISSNDSLFDEQRARFRTENFLRELSKTGLSNFYLATFGDFEPLSSDFYERTGVLRKIVSFNEWLNALLGFGLKGTVKIQDIDKLLKPSIFA